MRTRRIFLATGLGLLVASAGQRAQARVSAEVEASGYGGETTGGWVCGPVGTVQYGGLAAGATVSQRPAGAPKGQGGTASVAVSGELQAIDIDERSGPSTAPPERFLLGGRARGGYRWRWIGVEGGAGVYNAWTSAEAIEPAVAIYPDVELSVGRRDLVYGVLGMGAPLATTVQRPGLYAGASLRLPDGFGFDVRAGAFRQGPDTANAIGLRSNLAGYFPLVAGSDELALKLGGSLGLNTIDEVDYEASLGFVVRFDPRSEPAAEDAHAP